MHTRNSPSSFIPTKDDANSGHCFTVSFQLGKQLTYQQLWKGLSYDSNFSALFQPSSVAWALHGFHQLPAEAGEPTVDSIWRPLHRPGPRKTASRLCSSLWVSGQEAQCRFLGIRYSGESEGSQDSTHSISVPLTRSPL